MNERDAIIAACHAIANCSPLEHAVAAMDSCVERGLVRLEELRGVHTTAAGRRAAALADNRSQSGLETRVKLFLRKNRITFRQQVHIHPAGRVDFLIGRRLVVEVDGQEHHIGERFEIDRRRDAELKRLGYEVLRLSYRMVMHEWEEYSGLVRHLVRTRKHLYPKLASRMGG